MSQADWLYLIDWKVLRPINLRILLLLFLVDDMLFVSVFWTLYLLTETADAAAKREIIFYCCCRWLFNYISIISKYFTCCLFRASRILMSELHAYAYRISVICTVNRWCLEWGHWKFALKWVLYVKWVESVSSGKWYCIQHCIILSYWRIIWRALAE